MGDRPEALTLSCGSSAAKTSAASFAMMGGEVPQQERTISPPLPEWLQGRPIAERDHEAREERTHELLESARVAKNDHDRQAYLEQVVLLNGPVAEAIASRYRARGIDGDDLTQVAYLGLVKAARGYRVGEGPGFLAYAVPTISGEIKRHFRDFGWIVRPPRRVQELRSAAASTRSSLFQLHGRSPTQQDVADALGVSHADVAEAMLADGCFTAMSLDAPGQAGSTAPLGDSLVDEADDFAQAEAVAELKPALAALSDRDREILVLRFLRGWTQEQIGQHIGVSQMQVSRLLTRILATLRSNLGDDVDGSRSET